MAHSEVIFPADYAPGRIDMLPEGEDYWFTLKELVAFVGYNQPSYNWERLVRQYPWRYCDGERRFSAYAVWYRWNSMGQQYMMPPDFRAYFEARAAALQEGAAVRVVDEVIGRLTQPGAQSACN